MLLQLQKSLTFQCQTTARKNETCRCMRGSSAGQLLVKKVRQCMWNNLTSISYSVAVMMQFLLHLVWCERQLSPKIQLFICLCCDPFKILYIGVVGIYHSPKVLWGILCSTKTSHVIYMANISLQLWYNKEIHDSNVQLLRYREISNFFFKSFLKSNYRTLASYGRSYF